MARNLGGTPEEKVAIEAKRAELFPKGKGGCSSYTWEKNCKG